MIGMTAGVNCRNDICLLTKNKEFVVETAGILNFQGKMTMEKEQRLEAFEKMLAAVQTNYEFAVGRMTELKADGKEKTATYRQLMCKKLKLQNILPMYKIYGLLD